MNTVKIEGITRSVKVASLERNVSLERVKVASDYHFLQPAQVVDVPIERKGSDDN